MTSKSKPAPAASPESSLPESGLISLALIVVPTRRLRALQRDQVAGLAESMALVGLLHPIVVKPAGPDGVYEVRVGAHRFEAAKLLNWETIPATICAAVDIEHAELAEIDENLIRAELSPAERALHVGRRKELYEKLNPATKHGATGKGRAKSRQVGGSNERFSKDTAKKTGQSERKIQREAQRAESVVVLADIVGTSLDGGTELDALGRLPAAEQRALAERARSGEEVSAHKPPKPQPTPGQTIITSEERKAQNAADEEAAQLDTVCQTANFAEPALPPAAPANDPEPALAAAPAASNPDPPELKTPKPPPRPAGIHGLAARRRVASSPPKPTTHTEIMAMWLPAPPEERARFINNVGKELLTLFPDDWVAAVEEWLAAKQTPPVLH